MAIYSESFSSIEPVWVQLSQLLISMQAQEAEPLITLHPSISCTSPSCSWPWMCPTQLTPKAPVNCNLWRQFAFYPRTQNSNTVMIYSNAVNTHIAMCICVAWLAYMCYPFVFHRVSLVCMLFHFSCGNICVSLQILVWVSNASLTSLVGLHFPALLHVCVGVWDWISYTSDLRTTPGPVVKSVTMKQHNLQFVWHVAYMQVIPSILWFRRSCWQCQGGLRVNGVTCGSQFSHSMPAAQRWLEISWFLNRFMQ